MVGDNRQVVAIFVTHFFGKRSGWAGGAVAHVSVGQEKFRSPFLLLSDSLVLRALFLDPCIVEQQNLLVPLLLRLSQLLLLNQHAEELSLSLAADAFEEKVAMDSAYLNLFFLSLDCVVPLVARFEVVLHFLEYGANAWSGQRQLTRVHQIHLVQLLHCLLENLPRLEREHLDRLCLFQNFTERTASVEKPWRPLFAAAASRVVELTFGLSVGAWLF